MAGVKAYDLNAAGEKQPAAPKDEKPQKGGRGLRFGGAPEIGIILICYAAIGWLAGSRFTVDGAIAGLNWFLGWLTVPIRVAPLTGWALLGAAAIVGIIVSRAEIVRFPIRVAITNGKPVITFLGLGVLSGWTLTVGVDGYTTYIGLVTLPPDAWPIHRWVASHLWAASSASAWLTFTPEIAFLVGIYLIGWTPPAWLR